ncbi:hypothetical protein BT96DRAFT_1023309 [Gymnopus androsaceus JB14]|uniref:Uncharacterized protein n=1 Tax=Gymnopus androsaceus JB14 TaxID=1447944 RepID=A0A6A4H537_9AGAR|nr:hypothetical protein BT96DRAFT_1023309 [Gymnopus androsaceus JB14]
MFETPHPPSTSPSKPCLPSTHPIVLPVLCLTLVYPHRPHLQGFTLPHAILHIDLAGCHLADFLKSAGTHSPRPMSLKLFATSRSEFKPLLSPLLSRGVIANKRLCALEALSSLPSLDSAKSPTSCPTLPFFLTPSSLAMPLPLAILKRRFYKNWYRLKKKAFTRYAKKHAEDGGKSIARELERIRKYCTVVRVLVHTQIRKTGLRRRRRTLWRTSLSRSALSSSRMSVWMSLPSRFRGCQEAAEEDAEGSKEGVACIGAWHPSKVMFSVAHAGQNGYYHRTEINMYRIGSSSDDANATTESDISKSRPWVVSLIMVSSRTIS